MRRIAGMPPTRVRTAGGRGRAPGGGTEARRVAPRRAAAWAALLGLMPAAGVLAAAGDADPALAATAAPSCSAPAGTWTCAVSFTTPGTGGSYTVPAGVNTLSVTLYGGAGGTNYNEDGVRGHGAEVTASLAVSPEAVLGVDVGGAGAGGVGVASAAGGVNGGGSASYAGGGGGATDVTSSGTQLLVAGGGGGAGADIGGLNDCTGSLGTGGAGGSADTAGSAGQTTSGSGYTLAGGGGGAAGTTSGPGAGGTAGAATGTDSCGSGLSRGQAGAAGSGGHGGNGNEQTFGGGGGGGYFGGGAGGGGATESDENGDTVTAGSGGGGGGSSYGGGAGVSGYTVNDSAALVNAGNGEAVFSYPDPVATGAPSYATTSGQALSVPAGSGLLSSSAATSAPAGDTLTASGPASGGTAQGGTVTVNPDGSFSYTPPPGFSGGDSFSYTITDGSGDYVTATAAITVQPIAQTVAFTSTAASPSVAGGATYTPAATGGASGNPVTFSIDPSSTPGACSISGGVISFTGPGTCVVDASQAGGGGYAPGQASQDITVDTAPGFVLDSPPLTATAGQLYSYTFTASGSPAPAYALAAGTPSWLSVDAAAGTVSGTPPAGTTSFSYEVTAANPAGTTTAGPFTVTVTTASTKADISAALSCPRTLTVHETGSCALSVTNQGPAAASRVTAAVALPAALAEVSCSSDCARHGNVLTWQQPALTAGAAVQYTVTVRASRAGKALVLGVAVSRSPDPHPSNNVSVQQITIGR